MSKFEEIKVTCNDNFDAVFAVNHDLISDEQWHEINNFWGDSKWRLEQVEGDIVLAVLMMIAKRCFYVQVSDDLNSYGVMTAFDYNADEGQEGFPLLDGSEGILLKSIDIFEFDCSLFDIAKAPLTEMPSTPQPN